MEIQNTQIGQVFASLAPKNSEVVEADIQNNTSVLESSEPATSSDTRRGNTRLAIGESNNTERQQILSQGSQTQADKSEEERNGIELDDAVAKVESFLKVQNRDLAFTIDEDTKSKIMEVFAAEDAEIIEDPADIEE